MQNQTCSILKMYLGVGLKYDFLEMYVLHIPTLLKDCHDYVESIIVLHKILHTKHFHVDHDFVSFRYSYVIQ